MDENKALAEFAENFGFHHRDHTYFKRCSDGSVAIVKTGLHMADPHVVHLIDPNSWASIVSSVSAQGETGEHYRTALAFHGGQS